MSEAETIEQREQRELTLLLWFFWGGILVACIGESALVFLMRRTGESVGASVTGVHLVVVACLAVGMWVGATVVYQKQAGGGGFPTAIFCWMLAKASLILSFVMYFLTPGWGFTTLLVGGFVMVMMVLHPGKFVDSESTAEPGT